MGSFRFWQNLAMTNERVNITINALNANKEPKSHFTKKKKKKRLQNKLKLTLAKQKAYLDTRKN
ncbi:hypothetical protein CQA40_06800 [Helicobacter sp. MIT 01-3238]|nr:hypothetical protein CQA40_06800 [Helicobacter sp. MIT 01-3238]